VKRILLAGILAGVVVFVWSALDHMLLPFGHMGVRRLPQEDATMAALKASIPEGGLYVFPGMDMEKKMTSEGYKAFEARFVAGPTGLLVISPGGESPMMPRQLTTELLTDVVAGCIAAWVVSLTAAPFGRRALLVMLLGVFAWLSVSLSHWIWYHFPFPYILAEGIDQIVGWLLGGLAIAWVYRRS
jgi:hypothetical protein